MVSFTNQGRVSFILEVLKGDSEPENRRGATNPPTSLLAGPFMPAYPPAQFKYIIVPGQSQEISRTFHGRFQL